MPCWAVARHRRRVDDDEVIEMASSSIALDGAAATLLAP